jgi:FkbH-like protein
MSEIRSYKFEEFSSNAESEVRRLKAQVELFWEKEVRCYRAFGLRDGMSILECGCGPGCLLEKLSAEFPASTVTGVEIDPCLAKIAARQRAAAGAARFEILQQSLMALGFAENSFDFVISRLVLEHLPNPVSAVKEIFRVLKPGGKAILIDNDFEFHLRTHPDIAELKDLYGAYCRARKDEGGNPMIGRELPGILATCGFTHIDLEILSAHSHITGDALFLQSESVAISTQLVKNGYLPRETLDSIAVQWHALFHAPDHAFFRQIFVAVGEKWLHEKQDVIPETKISPIAARLQTTPQILWTENQPEFCRRVQDYLREKIACALDIPVPEVSDDASLFDVGFDSLAAVDVKDGIQSDLGIALAVADFFEKQTVRKIAQLLIEKMLQKMAATAVQPLQPDLKIEPIAVLADSDDSGKTRLSYNQQSLWFLNQLAPNSPAYHIAAACRIFSEMDLDALQHAIAGLIERHPSLRTTYHLGADDHAPFQRVHDRIQPPLEHIDVSGWPEDAIKETIAAHYRQPFDLENGPVFKIRLFTFGKNEHILLFTIHHIACDAWSLNFFLNEFNILYSAHATSSPHHLDPVRHSYSDYVRHEQSLICSEKGRGLAAFWKQKLDGCPSILYLPADLERPAVQTFKGSSRFFTVKNSLYAAIMHYARNNRITPYAFLLSGFQILLHRLSGTDDILVGTPAACRNRKDDHDILGNFVNPVVVRSHYTPGCTFLEFVAETAKSVLELLDYQEYPFPLLIKDLGGNRDPGRSPIFQVMFNLLHRRTLGASADFLCPAKSPEPVEFGTLKILPYPILQQEGQFDLTLEIIDTDHSLYGALKYDSSLFKPETVQGFIDRYLATIQHAINQPDAPIDRYVKPAGPAQSRDRRSLQIAVASTFTIELIEPALQFWMEKLDIDARIAFAPYNQVFQQLLDPASLFASNTQGVNIVLLRLDDWAKTEGTDPGAMMGEKAGQILSRNVDEFLDAIRAATSRSTTFYIVALCPPSPNLMETPAHAALFAQVEEHLCRKLKPINTVCTLSSGHILSAYQVDEYYEPLGEAIGHIPYTGDFFVSLGTTVSRIIFSRLNKPRKAIALDCDQTLWKGVVGEDGAKGVIIDENCKWLQGFILEQYHAGMLICLCSKNNAADVFAVFDQHPDMLLTRNHITLAKIDWEPKSANLRAMSRELNIGLDTFIFIDDNPVECAEVRSVCPEVLTLQIPEPGAGFKSFFRHIWAFDHLTVTQEDLQRSEFYRSSHQRDDLLKSSASFSAFIAKLQLEISITEINSFQIARVSQLTHRVNQFNLSAVRRSEGDIESLCRSDQINCYSTTVSDRFGDYGLVGAVIVRITADVLDVDTFLLSCRSLGKGVEHRMLAYLGALAQNRGQKTVRLHYTPTPRNQPIHRFLNGLSQAHVIETDQGMVYEISSKDAAKTAFTPETAESVAIPEKAVIYTSQSAGIAFGAEGVFPHFLLTDIAVNFSNIADIQKGITDRIALATGRPATVSHPALSKTGSPAGTQIEAHIASVWRRILNLEFIGFDDKFFDIGGKSIQIPLILIQLQKEYNITLSIVDMFQFPTIRALAAFVDNPAAADTSVNAGTIAGRQKAAMNRHKQRALAARKRFSGESR